jgi:pyruvate,water dikinase
MLTSASFQEEPDPLMVMLRAYARLDSASPLDALAAQAAERERETERVLQQLAGRAISARLPFLTYAFALQTLLPCTHAAIRYRERARLKQALLYSRCRQIALALGDALAARATIAARDDVFFLTIGELTDLARGGEMAGGALQSLIATRRAEHERLAATTPPDAFTLDAGEYLSDGATQNAPEDHDVGGDLRGTGACGGRVTGRATVLESVSQAERLARGDILVTKQTDPGWGPVFFLIAGLVIERGGMLSHGAIIAREFGIPCVVGIKHAMARIQSGATVSVDGDQGVVHVVD